MLKTTLTMLSLAVFASPIYSEAPSPKCQRISGFVDERLAVGPTCASPVGLCTVAQMYGGLRGEQRYTASAVIPSADTAATGIVFVIGDTQVVGAELGGKRGTITIKNAAAYRTIGNGDLVDIQTIMGGTGDFAGATGSLRISGNFLSATGGRSEYEGNICVQ